MSRLMDKLKNIFTAMAYAEAGDFDAVKQILREESDQAEAEERSLGECSRQPALPAL